MVDSSAAIDKCAENQICSSKKGPITSSSTSLYSCACGPECGSAKCDGRKSTSLVAWDDLRTKIFLLLIAAFAIWMVIYIPISITAMNESEPSHTNYHHHHG